MRKGREVHHEYSYAAFTNYAPVPSVGASFSRSSSNSLVIAYARPATVCSNSANHQFLGPDLRAITLRSRTCRNAVCDERMNVSSVVGPQAELSSRRSSTTGPIIQVACGVRCHDSCSTRGEQTICASHLLLNPLIHLPATVGRSELQSIHIQRTSDPRTRSRYHPLTHPQSLAHRTPHPDALPQRDRCGS